MVVCAHTVSYAHTCMHTDMYTNAYMQHTHMHTCTKNFAIYACSYQLDIYVQVVHTYFQLCLNHQFHNLTIESYVIQYIESWCS